MSVLRRIAVIVFGVTVIVLGVAMLFLPGPGLLTIVAGLAVLGSEFEPPRRWLASLRDRMASRR